MFASFVVIDQGLPYTHIAAFHKAGRQQVRKHGRMGQLLSGEYQPSHKQALIEDQQALIKNASLVGDVQEGRISESISL